MTRGAPEVQVTVLTPPGDRRAELAADVRAGLGATPRTLPAKWLYDHRGSELFEQITRLDEYYPTRTELAILRECAAQVVGAVRPEEIVELGSGSSRKTVTLLEAMWDAGTGRRYVPLDVSRSAIEQAAVVLARDHPWLEVRGFVADFHAHLDLLPPGGRRLLAFLGSTIGNLDRGERAAFFARVRATLGPDDGLLLGADLVKDPAVLVRAYDDAEGVTAAFNRNVLRVLNHELDGDVPVEAFGHEARWDADEERVEMWLRASRPVHACLPGADLELVLECGEGIRTEISSKFRRAELSTELRAAGLAVEQWHTDDRGWFALALLRAA